MSNRARITTLALAAFALGLPACTGASATSGRTLAPARQDRPVPAGPSASVSRPVLASGDSLGRAMFEAPVTFASRFRAERRYATVPTE